MARQKVKISKKLEDLKKEVENEKNFEIDELDKIVSLASDIIKQCESLMESALQTDIEQKQRRLEEIRNKKSE